VWSAWCGEWWFGLGQSDWALVETHQAHGRIQTLRMKKASRTVAQKKIDSQLLYALKQKRGETKGVPTGRIDLEFDKKGRASWTLQPTLHLSQVTNSKSLAAR
jgi:hypothetical protein